MVVSTGAGWEMRRTLGVTVFAGMIGVTLFGIFLTPVFFYVIEWINDLWRSFRPREEPLRESTASSKVLTTTR
jgi:predicted RND superfamily exporter protein